MSLVKSSAVVGICTILSRIAGFVRDSLIAKYLGAGTLSDAFFVAFRLPNIFRSLFAEGAFNAAFVPMYSKMHDESHARNFANNAFSVLVFMLFILTIVAQLAMPGLVWLLASGYEYGSEKFNLSVDLTRITFFYLLFVSAASLLGGVLNSMNKFIAFSIAPLLLNMTLVGALVFFSDYGQTAAHSISWGVFAAGIIQFIWLYIYAYRAGFKLKPPRPRLDADIKKLLKRMVPVIIGAGVLQINVLINTQIASYVSDGAVSFLYYADRVGQFPLAVIGTAIGTALLPMLSRQLKSDAKEAVATQNKAFELAWFLSIPCAFGIAALAWPITEVLFERGEFTSFDTNMVAKALLAYSFAIPAFVLVKIFVPGFYAAEDTKTPVQIGIFCIVINVLISLVLVYGFNFDHLALAIGSSVSSWINALLLIVVLIKRKMFKFQPAIAKRAILSLICAALMGGVAMLIYDNAGLNAAISLVLSISIAGVFYLGLAVLIKAADLNMIKGYLKKK